MIPAGMSVYDGLQNGHVCIDDLRAERDRRGALPIAYGVSGGRGYVELIHWDGECVTTIDALGHQFPILPDAFDVLAQDERTAQIVRRFVAAWEASEVSP